MDELNSSRGMVLDIYVSTSQFKNRQGTFLHCSKMQVLHLALLTADTFWSYKFSKIIQIDYGTGALLLQGYRNLRLYSMQGVFLNHIFSSNYEIKSNRTCRLVNSTIQF